MTRVAKAPCHLSEEENKPTLYIYILLYKIDLCYAHSPPRQQRGGGVFRQVSFLYKVLNFR